MEGKLLKINNIYTLIVNDKMVASNDEDFQIDYAIKKLSLKNCQAIENGYDLDELAEKHYNVHIKQGHTKEDSLQRKIDFILGFQKAIELIGDKKFSEEDVKFMFQLGFNLDNPISKNEYDVHIQSLQQTEWNVEIVMECVIGCENLIINGENSLCCGNKKPKLDTDGCLILKRK